MTQAITVVLCGGCRVSVTPEDVSSSDVASAPNCATSEVQCTELRVVTRRTCGTPEPSATELRAVYRQLAARATALSAEASREAAANTTLQISVHFHVISKSGASPRHGHLVMALALHVGWCRELCGYTDGQAKRNVPA